MKFRILLMIIDVFSCEVFLQAYVQKTIPTCCQRFQHSLLTLDILQHVIISFCRDIDTRKNFCNDLEQFGIWAADEIERLMAQGVVCGPEKKR